MLSPKSLYTFMYYSFVRDNLFQTVGIFQISVN